MSQVLAVSDVVVFRTRSERLHRDMFVFLGSASRAYSQHFQTALQVVGKLIRSSNNGGCAPALGPAVVVFQETLNTRPLQFSECYNGNSWNWSRVSVLCCLLNLCSKECILWNLSPGWIIDCWQVWARALRASWGASSVSCSLNWRPSAPCAMLVCRQSPLQQTSLSFTLPWGPSSRTPLSAHPGSRG